MPERGTLIGLGGFLRSGKDTVADHLVARYGWHKVGMSDPLDLALQTLNPLIPLPGLGTVRYRALHALAGYTEAKKNPEVRRLLQTLGTDVVRDMVDQNAWVDIARKTISDLLDSGENVVLTATRFQNEAQMIRDLGGHLVWVDRRSSRVESDSHKSETGVEQTDFAMNLFNYGDLDFLHDQIESFLPIIVGNLQRK